MNRPLNWISLLLAALAFGLNATGANAHGLILGCAGLALLLAAFEIVADPKRALFLLTFLLSLPVLVSVMSLYSQAAAEAALVSVALAFQIRLFFLRTGRANREENLELAASLRNSVPAKGLVFVDMDIEGECPSSDIEPGHLIRIRPEDSLPADGQVTFGSSFVDESALTGDRESNTKSMGSFVSAGTKNRNGSFIYRASLAPKNSFVLKLALALEKGFPFESLLGRPFLLLEGMLIFGALVIYIFTGPSLTPLLNVFLVSTGTLLAASLWARDSRFLRRSAKQGFWWKSKASLMKIAATRMLVSGARGAVTEGRLRLSAMQGSGDLSEDGAIRLIGPLARRLENDAAFALLQELQTRNIRLEMIEAYMELPGGASGIILGEDLRWVDLENARLEDLPIARVESFVAEHLRAGEKIYLLFRNTDVAAAFAFADRVLPTAGQGIHLLKREDVPFMLVTAESELPTRRMREELAITHFTPDVGDEGAKRLLERLEADGAHPLWLATPGWNVSGGVIPSFLASSLGGQAEAMSARGDIHSVAKMIQLAKEYTGGSGSLFWTAAIFQAALICACPYLDPRLMVVFSAFPALFMLGRGSDS
jgi:cation transport ATPase